MDKLSGTWTVVLVALALVLITFASVVIDIYGI